MAARSDQDNVISRHSDNMADTIDKPTQAASELNVAVQPNLTPVTSTTRVSKPCMFYVHTMEHQANDNTKPFELEFECKPSEVTAGDVINSTINKLSLPPDTAKKCFAMWLTSPLLQLQLKWDYHPYELYKQWKDLLVCYTNCDYDAKENDIPILSFQRNAFLSLKDEKDAVDKATIHLLYEEAKLNVLRGNYPMDTATLVDLAGMQAAHLQPSTNKLPLVDYFPYHMVRKTRGLILPKLKPPYKPSLEEQLRTAKERYSSDSKVELERKYLEKCRNTDYYGSVFFTGQTDRAFTNTSMLFGHSDLPVSVAINTQGLHIISRSAPPEVLIFLPFCKMSWRYIECHPSGEEYYSSILLEYDSKNDSKTKRLKIYSRQAPLMENMIKAVVGRLNSCGHIRSQDEAGDDETDSGGQPRNPRRCREHPLLVCEDVEKKTNSTSSEQPRFQPPPSEQSHLNGRSDPDQMEMWNISSSIQGQHEQPSAAVQASVA